MEVTGKIKMIGNTLNVGSSGFRKRELVVTTEEQYPQHILIEFVQDKTQLLDTLRLGQEVKVSINFRGREWINPQGEAKYFNQIQGWKIESKNNVQEGPFETIPNEDLKDAEDDGLSILETLTVKTPNKCQDVKPVKKSLSLNTSFRSSV